MSVLRFEPFRDPFRELDRLISMAASGTRAPLGMPMDVYRAQDGSYHLEADLPGVDPDSVEVTVEHSTLTIRAERAPHYGESEQVIAAERPQGSFTRQFSLGEGVDSEHLTAGYANGVLHVTIPASPRPRPAGSRSPIRPAAAAPSRAAPPGRARRRAAGRAAAERPPCRISGRAASRVRCWPPGRRAGAGRCRAACPPAGLDRAGDHRAGRARGGHFAVPATAGRRHRQAGPGRAHNGAHARPEPRISQPGGERHHPAAAGAVRTGAGLRRRIASG